MGFVPFVARTEVVRKVGEYVSSVSHMLEFSRGAIDSRPIVFYLTSIVFMIFATVKVIESRKWK
jgi:ABC-2 type transport system permease protein